MHLQTSRYHNEYREVSFIARGGFGAVFRATNKLDGCDYAIKKILLRYCNRDLCAKILREVTTLARLSHPNVVCYKTAWLEPYLASRPGGATGGSERARLAIEQEQAEEMVESSSSWSPAVEAEEATSSSGVVFEASKRGENGNKGRQSEFSFPLLNVKFKRFFSSDVSVASMKALSIRELDGEEEEEVEGLPLVTGMAATPPNAAGDELMRRHLRPKKDNTALVRFNLGKVGGDEVDGGRSTRRLRKDRALLYLQMQLCDQVSSKRWGLSSRSFILFLHCTTMYVHTCTVYIESM